MLSILVFFLPIPIPVNIQCPSSIVVHVKLSMLVHQLVSSHEFHLRSQVRVMLGDR
jgi:hypothetical protein